MHTAVVERGAIVDVLRFCRDAARSASTCSST